MILGGIVGYSASSTRASQGVLASEVVVASPVAQRVVVGAGLMRT